MPIKYKTVDNGEKLYFSQNVKTLRKKCGITQEMMADKLNISLKTLQNWENQKACPDTIESVFLLCDILECDVEYIFGLQSLPRRVDADIHDETGLSKSAISYLKTINSDKKMGDTADNILAFLSSFIVDLSEERINTLSQMASILYAIKHLSKNPQHAASMQGEIEISGLYWKCQDCLTSFIKRQVQKEG